MDQVQAQRHVVAVAELGGAGVADTVGDDVGQARPGDQFAADGRAAGQVQDDASQTRVPAAQFGREPAVPAAHVQHAPRALRYPQCAGDLRCAEPGELVLAGDVAAPVGVVDGGVVVVCGGRGAACHVRQAGPPAEVLLLACHEVGHRQWRLWQ